MKKIMYMAVAAIAALSSCSSDEFAGSNGISGEAKVFTGTIDNDNLGSRSTLVSNTANWESTDKVCINGAIYTVTPDGTDATKATFTKESGTEPTGTYKAFYADGANSGNYWDSSTSSFKLPASYTYSESGKFNMPMYAESETTSLGFKNICGVLAINVPENTTSVVVKSENQMNGAFTATAEGVLTFTSTTITTSEQTITVTYPTSTSTQIVYVPVPAGNYDALVIECNSQSMTVKKTVTVERNKIYSITFSSNSVTTRGLAEATVSAGSLEKKYVAWVQLWSGGPKFAAFNVGATITDYKNANSTSSTASEKYKSPDYVGGYYGWGGTTSCSSSDYYSGTDYDTNGNLKSDYDAATKLWGSNWRMPTKNELTDLSEGVHISSGTGTGTYCKWTWCSGASGSQYVEGCTLAGYKIEGLSGYASNSVFFPAAGRYDANSSKVVGDQGVYGDYWSATPFDWGNAYELYFSPGAQGVGSSVCSYGCSVRAVLK